MLGFTEMILVPFGELRVMKNKSQKLEHIEDICHGHNIDSQVHLILLVLEEGNNIIYNNRFLVFARNCGNCHGIVYKKYDVLLDKAYK